MTKRLRRIIGGVLTALFVAVSVQTALAVTWNQNGGIHLDYVSWYSSPPTKWSYIDVGPMQCVTTCGLTRVSIDWDDGTVDSVYVTLPADPSVVWHEYADNGLRHAKVFIEDEDQYGNWISIEDLDIHINY